MWVAPQAECLTRSAAALKAKPLQHQHQSQDHQAPACYPRFSNPQRRHQPLATGHISPLPEFQFPLLHSSPSFNVHDLGCRQRYQTLKTFAAFWRRLTGLPGCYLRVRLPARSCRGFRQIPSLHEQLLRTFFSDNRVLRSEILFTTRVAPSDFVHCVEDSQRLPGAWQSFKPNVAGSTFSSATYHCLGKPLPTTS